MNQTNSSDYIRDFTLSYYGVSDPAELRNVLRGEGDYVTAIKQQFKDLGLAPIDTDAGFNAVFRATFGSDPTSKGVNAVDQYASFLNALVDTVQFDFSTLHNCMSVGNLRGAWMEKIATVLDWCISKHNADAQCHVVMFYVEVLRTHPYFLKGMVEGR